MYPRALTPVFAVLSLLPLLLTGCSTSFDPANSPPTTGSVGNIQGMVEGGRQPISGGHLYLYATSTAVPVAGATLGGYGGAGIAATTTNAATSLLTNAVLTNNNGSSGKDSNNNYYIVTDSGGRFNITNDYACTSGTEVYILVTGGSSDGVPADANSAISLMSVLGSCPAAGTGTSTYFNDPTGGNYIPFLVINEVTTVASAYALAGFATDSTHIGISGSALAQTGIANAAATVPNLVGVGSGIVNMTTPGSGTKGTGTVPYDEINTLANILAACVNTTGPTSTACTTLFRNATNDGVTCANSCGDEPTDTATAAINIAHFPGMNSTNTTNNNVYNLYALQTGTSPYSTNHLTAQPNDFSMQVQYTGGGLTPQYSNGFQTAVDASGNVWVSNSQGATANTAGTVLSEFNNLGVPANQNGYTSLGLSTPYGLAISSDSGHVWIADYDLDEVVDFKVSTSAGTAHPVTGGSGPVALAFDSSGDIWLGNINTNTLMELSSSGSLSHTFSNNGLDLSVGVAVAPTTSGKVWVADGDGDVSVFSSTGSAVSNPAHPAQGNGPVFDSSGNAWFSTSMDIPSLWKLPASGAAATASYSLPGAVGSDIFDIAIDGASNLWISGMDFSSGNPTNNRIWVMNSSGTSLTGVVNGFAPAPSNTTQVNSLAVDGSGNVWYTSSSDSTLHEIVGAGVPVVTPLATGTVNGTLATRP